MVNNTFKSILSFVLTLGSFLITAQDAPPSDGVFRLQNVATGKFLTDAGKSATAVTMSDTGEEPSTHFKFVQSGSYYNIDSELLGILRAPGAGGPGGAYVVVSTTKASPATDTDKTWTIYHDETNDTYRFESRTAGRFLYHNADGTVTHSTSTADDDRSNWEAIPTSQSLSVIDNELNTTALKVFPNPAKEIFTISLNNIDQAKVIIYNTLGKSVYSGLTSNGSVQIENNRNFAPGLYLIKAISKDNKVYHSKLIIK